LPLGLADELGAGLAVGGGSRCFAVMVSFGTVLIGESNGVVGSLPVKLFGQSLVLSSGQAFHTGVRPSKSPVVNVDTFPDASTPLVYGKPFVEMLEWLVEM
jgi:hypothetical protein